MQQQMLEKMPRYQSHKEVRALKIASVSTASLGKVKLTFADTYFAAHEVDANMVERYMPSEGDYFVVYADGYQSISPVKAFEEGYTKIP
jgi:hypothetical protein